MPDSLSFNEYYDDTIIPLSKRQRRRLEKRKQQNGLRLQDIEPITDTQTQVFDSYLSGKNLMCHGVAGTGKTFISSYLAIRDILERYDDKDTLQIVRSVVPTRDMGFLPGSQKEKSRVYEAPYYNIFGELFGRGDAYEVLKSRNQVQFTTTSFVRGLTFNDSIVIVDECQNMTYHELDSIITRVGENSKIMFCGDASQSDLIKTNEKNGIIDFMKILRVMPSFDIIEFGIEDVCRSGLVKEYLVAKNELNL